LPRSRSGTFLALVAHAHADDGRVVVLRKEDDMSEQQLSRIDGRLDRLESDVKDLRIGQARLEHRVEEVHTRMGVMHEDLVDKIKALPDHEVYKLAPEQLLLWKKASDPLIKTWAEGVRKTGVDPDAAMAELRKMKLTSLRQLAPMP
jgi:septal ring factor EnvC (AmiA/AmiB activator)